MIYSLEKDNIWFPDPALADDDGLLAVGGDLSVERLMLAYKHGIFPWFSDDTPILWYSPHDRFVLFPEKIKISSSMKQLMRRGEFEITSDQNFEEVIAACSEIERAEQPGTWITDDMRMAYIRLHRMGFAHSLEVWQKEKLVGGLYGVIINRVFCGESMFSKVSNASKAALVSLCTNFDFQMIDCQMHTPHLESMGAEYITREKYLELLSKKF
ncbi:leucyl/phenylalanyl-tRNA--protein transferase [Flavihumibacter sp. R14]|nr:leucyl/phenylalanyl-tRNA--protein transferase [Flavihumibacter soli]